MATKKQKREAALARRDKFLAEEREIGLRAQQEDRERRAARMESIEKKKAERTNKLALSIFVASFRGTTYTPTKEKD